MNYIFFDIESADGSVSICEFGYIITDEKFNILEKKLFLINPEYKYNYGVKLHHSKREYSKSPNFHKFYEKIKKLLTSKNSLIFGYSVQNDIRYIANNCKRYNQSQIFYDAIDVQRIFDKYIKSKNEYTSLLDACKALLPQNIIDKLISHSALDDSIKTMLLLKQILIIKKLSILDLIKNENFKINSLKHYEQLLKNKKLKLMREKNKFECNKIWNEFCSLYSKDDKKFLNKHICISSSIKYNKIQLKRAVNYIKTKGYCPIKDFINADILIVASKKDKSNILNTLKNNKKYKFIIKI